MQGQIDELKSQLDAARDLLHRAEADADLQRRERDRLKGQLLESKALLASLRQQVRDMSERGERVKARTRLGLGGVRGKWRRLQVCDMLYVTDGISSCCKAHVTRACRSRTR